MRRRTLLKAAGVAAVRPAVLIARPAISTYVELQAALAFGWRDIAIARTVVVPIGVMLAQVKEG